MKKIFMPAMAMISAAMMMVSCADAKVETPVSALEGEWDVVAVNVDTVALDMNNQEIPVDPYLVFDLNEKMVYGNASCNQINAALVADTLVPGKVAVENIASTRMMCPAMNVEQALTAALESVKAFEALNANADTLALCNEAGAKVITLAKRAPYSKLEGEWAIVTVKGDSIAADACETAPFVGFSVKRAEKRLYGNAGCNDFNTVLELSADNNALSLANLAVTLKACKDMTVEQNVLAAFAEVAAYAVNENKLAFLDKEGNEVVVMEKK